jgi:hypothetical protein
MRASKGARRRQKRRLAQMEELRMRDPWEAEIRHAAQIASWRREIWRRAGDLNAPPVWDLVNRIRAELGEADGAMAAAEAVRALQAVMHNGRRNGPDSAPRVNPTQEPSQRSQPSELTAADIQAEVVRRLAAKGYDWTQVFARGTSR